MRSSFAIFYGVNLDVKELPILYFLVIGDKYTSSSSSCGDTNQESDGLGAVSSGVPCCSIGPLAFGRNRRSVIKFGEDRSVSVERCAHTVILKNGSDTVELNKSAPFVFYDLKKFEIPPLSKRKRSTLIQAAKALLSFLFDSAQTPCALAFALPAPHHRLLVKQLLDQSHLPDHSWKNDFLSLLNQLDDAAETELIQQGFSAIELGTTFDTPELRGRICFAVLIKILNNTHLPTITQRPTPPPLCVPFIPNIHTPTPTPTHTRTPEHTLQSQNRHDSILNNVVLLSPHIESDNILYRPSSKSVGSPNGIYAPTSAYLTRLDSTNSSSHLTQSEDFFLRTPQMTHSIILTQTAETQNPQLPLLTLESTTTDVGDTTLNDTYTSSRPLIQRRESSESHNCECSDIAITPCTHRICLSVTPQSILSTAPPLQSFLFEKRYTFSLEQDEHCGSNCDHTEVIDTVKLFETTNR